MGNREDCAVSETRAMKSAINNTIRYKKVFSEVPSDGFHTLKHATHTPTTVLIYNITSYTECGEAACTEPWCVLNRVITQSWIPSASWRRWWDAASRCSAARWGSPACPRSRAPPHARCAGWSAPRTDGTWSPPSVWNNNQHLITNYISTRCFVLS